MNLHLNVARAVFQADGKPDTEVRVLPRSDRRRVVLHQLRQHGRSRSGFIPPDRELQLAESLQFIADTIGARVPGRLPPFTRGWIGPLRTSTTPRSPRASGKMASSATTARCCA